MKRPEKSLFQTKISHNLKSKKLKKETYATGTASPAAKKILAEKNMVPSMIKGTGKDGRITKDDAVKAIPSMGTKGDRLTETSRKKLSMLTT